MRGVFLACLGATAAADLMQLRTPLMESKWGSYKLAFKKGYATVALEQEAFAAYAANEMIIEEHNAKGLSYTLGHNAYSDMTWEAFKSTYVSGMESNPYLRRQKNFDLAAEAVPAVRDAVDWVAEGAVTPIKNQGQCGSCWAFSTTGSFEGAYKIATGDLVSFSEQQLVSCDKVDDGCSGGLMDNAFKWIEENGGVCTESDYEYSSSGGTTGTCETTCSPTGVNSGFTDVTPGDEDALKSAVAMGPVSVAIEADKSVFQLYSSGVFTSAEECGTQLDHGVLAVGYGTDGGNDYWKVKNSWGTSWGESGYIRMERAVDCCGIASQPSYPTGVHAVSTSSVPNESPSDECGIAKALECGESVFPCIATCKTGIAACIECLEGDFATCCPCIEKIIPAIPCSGPAPGPTPTPGPSPTPGGQTHYGAPPCESDEQNVQVQGISGSFCSPPCTGGSCPTDVPSGVTATPTCLLQDTSGNKYCALKCTPSGNGECGTGACQEVQAGIGICTYGAAESFIRKLALAL